MITVSIKYFDKPIILFTIYWTILAPEITMLIVNTHSLKALEIDLLAQRADPVVLDL